MIPCARVSKRKWGIIRFMSQKQKQKQQISKNNSSNLTLCMLVFLNKMLQILSILTFSTPSNCSLPPSLKTKMYRHCLSFYNPCTKEFQCTDEQFTEVGADILNSVTSSVAAGTCLSSSMSVVWFILSLQTDLVTFTLQHFIHLTVPLFSNQTEIALMIVDMRVNPKSAMGILLLVPSNVISPNPTVVNVMNKTYSASM